MSSASSRASTPKSTLSWGDEVELEEQVDDLTQKLGQSQTWRQELQVENEELKKEIEILRAQSGKSKPVKGRKPNGQVSACKKGSQCFFNLVGECKHGHADQKADVIAFLTEEKKLLGREDIDHHCKFICSASCDVCCRLGHHGHTIQGNCSWEEFCKLSYPEMVSLLKRSKETRERFHFLTREEMSQKNIKWNAEKSATA